MGEIARWGGHVFEVTPQIVRSLNTLTVKAGIETDDMEADKQRYVARQAARRQRFPSLCRFPGFWALTCARKR